jgi:glycine/D-amino acid oxidase-like deaminating enzyme
MASVFGSIEMAANSSNLDTPAVNQHTIIIIGAGVVGLSLGLRALDLGFAVSLISQDPVARTTSAMAAGMIAPALEAMNDPAGAISYQRYKQAQDFWYEFAADLGLSDLVTMARPAYYVWRPLVDKGVHVDVLMTKLGDMGVKAKTADPEALITMGYGADYRGLTVEGDWLIPARGVLEHMRARFEARGGRLVYQSVVKVSQNQVSLANEEIVRAGYVVVAAGYGSQALSAQVAALKPIKPIKGHLMDIEAKVDEALSGHILRSPLGYFVFFADSAKYGASMQAGQGDLSVEPEVVADLTSALTERLPAGFRPEIGDMTPSVGVRAATPDNWPLIGRDKGSKVYLATGMRRNGWLFAPMAAKIIVDQIIGAAPSELSTPYDPNRF